MKTHTHTQHTPGPWHVIGNSIFRHGVPTAHLAPFDLSRIAEVVHRSDETLESEGDKEAQANARVIAAAPELLAALEAILEPIDAPGGTIRSITWQSIAQARAALEKAKGTP